MEIASTQRAGAKRSVRLSIDEDLYLELIRRFGTKRMHLFVNEAIRRCLMEQGGSR
jgi:Arc/MetJ family transcription regulator